MSRTHLEGQSPEMVSVKAFFHLVDLGSMFPSSSDMSSQHLLLQKHWPMVCFKSEAGCDWLFLTVSCGP